MIILITGPQGSGKTTQAKLLAQSLNFPLIMTGDAMRQLAKTNTPDGKAVRELLAQGKMAPDKVAAEYVKAIIAKKNFQQGFVIDGYPRTINQINLFLKLSYISSIINDFSTLFFNTSKNLSLR